ncbi:unnamed protein product [Pleuronectes platessa]|uniref:Uncharacterized protein n=1 Tax=Pleuronectes platessa TaxID=8262 RepID=A0A9N7U041_PLEPL|nr:unnamed protein product [Pleuronectes platessa]
MAEGVRPEDYCDEPAEDDFGEIIKCRSEDATPQTRAHTPSLTPGLPFTITVRVRRCSLCLLVLSLSTTPPSGSNQEERQSLSPHGSISSAYNEVNRAKSVPGESGVRGGGPSRHVGMSRRRWRFYLPL